MAYCVHPGSYGTCLIHEWDDESSALSLNVETCKGACGKVLRGNAVIASPKC